VGSPAVSAADLYRLPPSSAENTRMCAGFRIRIDLMRIRIRIRIQHFF
jgi:hypothetical protein